MKITQKTKNFWQNIQIFQKLTALGAFSLFASAATLFISASQDPSINLTEDHAQQHHENVESIGNAEKNLENILKAKTDGILTTIVGQGNYHSTVHVVMGTKSVAD